MGVCLRISKHRCRNFSSVLSTVTSGHQAPKFIKALILEDHFIDQSISALRTGSSCHCLPTRHDGDNFNAKVIGLSKTMGDI